MQAIPARVILQWALEIERNGKSFYEAAADKATDREVRTLFADLAHQEDRHYRTFERMLLKASDAPDAEETSDYYSFLQNALADALLGPNKGLDRARQAGNENEALRAAMAFEKDTLVFFFDLMDAVTPEQTAAVRAIIDEERDHLKQLSRVLQSGPWVI
ncbi:MAG: ferritin family protein [Anaerolineae bacterium]|jgi:rubrerythrin|nr:ferritin family protein [Chloroflexota bacterium]